MAQSSAWLAIVAAVSLAFPIPIVPSSQANAQSGFSPGICLGGMIKQSEDVEAYCDGYLGHDLGRGCSGAGRTYEYCREGQMAREAEVRAYRPTAPETEEAPRVVAPPIRQLPRSAPMLSAPNLNPPTGTLALVRVSSPTAPEVFFFERSSIRSRATTNQNAALIWELAVIPEVDRRLGVAASAYWSLFEIDCLERKKQALTTVALDASGRVLKKQGPGAPAQIEYGTTMSAYASVACRLGTIQGPTFDSVHAAISNARHP